MPLDDGHSHPALDGTFDVLETVELTQNSFLATDNKPDDSVARMHAGERLVLLKAKGAEIGVLDLHGLEIPV